jgi:phosphatidylserine/phosphatidylglycerophosphate/cardiolipin synthase-like enzyme
MEALLALPSHLRKRLIAALESGLLVSPCSPAALRSVLGVTEGHEALGSALLELKQLGIEGRAAAAWLRQLDSLLARQSRPDLVWSGPEVPGLHARNTRRVFEELIEKAERTIWASTYAFFDGPKAFELLARQMDAKPDLRVLLLLNIQRKRGDDTTADHLVRRFANRFWKKDWPGKARPRVFYDPRSIDPEGPSSVLHAKAMVVDEEAVFITSANLTEAALDRNIEIGLVMQDHALAATVANHFQILIDHKILVPLPLE